MYQYTMLGDSTAEVYAWAPKLLAAMEKNPIFTDVNSDQQQKGPGDRPEVIDRARRPRGWA